MYLELSKPEMVDQLAPPSNPNSKPSEFNLSSSNNEIKT
jgi:hypothetical protein